ncbi:hypothetical protein FBU30_003334 [Linnemannia zychae]|nr:hypothetical protein FBU30_003334 [Linnemannia zychae]
MDLETNLSSHQSKNISTRYRLQQFTARFSTMELSVLERLIITCPDLKVFNVYDATVNKFLRLVTSNAKLNARQRLANLAAQHCPKLEWYSFKRIEYILIDGKHLDDITRVFPHHIILTLTTGDFEGPLPALVRAPDFFSRITVLEIEPNHGMKTCMDLPYKILYYIPNLLHLHATKACLDTNKLWKPPVHAVHLTKRSAFANSMWDRKQPKHNARKLNTSQQAIAHNRSVTASNEGISTPLIWPFYRLKTFEIRFAYESSFDDFTAYISRNRLFRKLTRLNIIVFLLQLGQRKFFTDFKKSSPLVASLVVDSSVPYGNYHNSRSQSGSHDSHPQHSNAKTRLLEPERYPNLLLGLREIECLEECVLRTMEIPGLILAKDFEFLQRKSDFETRVDFYYPTTASIGSALPPKTGRKMGKNDQQQCNKRDDDEKDTDVHVKKVEHS